jgi:O-antigen/teichoic acid export membrane protein
VTCLAKTEAPLYVAVNTKIGSNSLKLIPVFIYRRIAHRTNLVMIVENISWLFLDKILRIGVGLLVGFLVARYFGPKQFGLFSFATALTDIFGTVAALGLQGIVVRDIVRNPGCTRETLGTAAALQLIAGLMSYLLMLVAISYLRPDDALARCIVAILGSIVLLEASKISVFLFESRVQLKYVVWVQSVVFVVFASIKIVLIYQKALLFAFVWATLAESVVVAVLILKVMHGRGLQLNTLHVSVDRAKSLLKDSWPLILSAVAISIYMKIDQIMLGQMVGDEAVGIYSAATRISEVWYFIPMVIATSVFPAILEAKKRSDEEYYLYLQKLFDVMAQIGLAIALLMTFLSTFIVTFVFGHAYRDAGQVLAIHVWAGVFVFLGVASSNWFLSENRQLMSFRRTLFGAISNVVLNLWLIPVYHGFGAALATVFSYAIAAFFADLAHKETRKLFFMKVAALNPLAVYYRFK